DERDGAHLDADLAEIDARPEACLDGPGAPPCGRNLDEIGAGIFVEPVELEVAVVVARRLGDGAPVLAKRNARPLDAIDDAVCFRRQRAADEAFGVAPEVAVVHARPGTQLALHHFEALVARHARHLLVLHLERAHGPGRAGLLPARLLPPLI